MSLEEVQEEIFDAEKARADILKFREEELSGVRKSVHLSKIENFDVSYLDEEDLRIWQKVRNESLTWDELKEYTQKHSYLKTPKNDDPEIVRYELIACIGNLASYLSYSKL